MPNQNKKRQSLSSVKKSIRRNDIDWLRVLAVIALLFYHSAQPFVTWIWHHLCFLAYLFVFSLLALPIFKSYLASQKPTFLKRMMDSMGGRWRLFAPAIPKVKLLGYRQN